MTILQTIHGELRWLVVFVAVIALVGFVYGLITKQDYSPRYRSLITGFGMAMALNFLLGLILLIALGLQQGVWPQPRVEHSLTMFLAVIIGARSARWQNLTDHRLIYRNNILAIVLSLTLVFLGVWRLRGGWIF